MVGDVARGEEECLETARLILRPFVPEDLDWLVPIFGDPDVMRFVGNGARTRAETGVGLQRMIMHWQQHGFGMWAVLDKPEKQLLGRCGLQFLDRTDEIELGYTLGKPFWGKGLATEAALASMRYGFARLQLKRIVAIARPENWASRRVMEKVGLRFEKAAHFYDTDVVYYAVTRDAFRR